MPIYTKSLESLNAAGTDSSVPILATLTTLITFDVDQPKSGNRNALLGLYSLATIEIENEGTNDALDQFEVQLKDHINGEWYSLVTDWTVLTDKLLFVSTSPAALATSSKAHIHLFIGCPYAMRIQAASAGANSDLAICRALLST